MPEEISLGEVLEAVNVGFTDVQQQFSLLGREMIDMKQDIQSMKAVMVTKSYLDDKLADLRGEFHLSHRAS